MTEQTWIEHDNEGLPDGLMETDWVEVQLRGHTQDEYIGPVQAEGFDWCYDDDPVLRYRLVPTPEDRT